MKTSLLKDLKILARLYRHRGELIFRPRWSKIPRCYQVNIRSRDGRFEADARLRRGSSDLSTFRQIFVKRDYDLTRLARGEEIKRIYSSIVERGLPLILDLGANIGLASLYFAGCWPEARIIAVEPAPDNYELLRNNLGGHDNIRPVHAAVAASAGTVRIANPGADAWGYQTESVAPGSDRAIAALPVSDLLKLEPLAIPFIAKIDIEGFEKDLFSANTGWVSRFPILIVELHDWMLPRSASAANFLRTIAPLDRDFVTSGENIYSITNGFASG
jgi:FkbM family methyltransferase